MKTNVEFSSVNSWTSQINKELLPIYQQSADLQDVKLTVIAEEGKYFPYFKRDTKVLKSCVAIKLERQGIEDGLGDFYGAIEMIKAELPNVRIG